MKKKISALLLSSFVAMSLAACSAPANNGTGGGEETKAGDSQAKGGEGSEAKVEDPKASISVQGEGPWKPYYEAAIKTMKEKFPESEIKLVEVGAFPNLDTIDSTDPSNPDVPDVFAIPADRLPSMINKSALAALPAQEMADQVGGYTDFPKYGDIMKDGEDYLAFPMNIETLIAFGNPKGLEANKIDPSKPLELKDAKGMEFASQLFNAWFAVAYTNSAGINLLDKEGDKFVSDFTKPWAELEPEKQAVITELFNYWQRVSKADPTLWDKDAAGGKIEEKFKAGEIGYIIEGPWSTPNLVKDVENLEIKPLAQLTLNGKPLSHWQGMWGLGVNSRIEEDEAKMTLAKELIKELVNPKNAEAFFKATGKILPNVPVADYEATGLSDAEKATIKATIESYETSENRPLFSEWGGVWDTWQNALLSWNNTKPANAEAAYKAVQDAFTAMMGNIGQ